MYYLYGVLDVMMLCQFYKLAAYTVLWYLAMVDPGGRPTPHPPRFC